MLFDRLEHSKNCFVIYVLGSNELTVLVKFVLFQAFKANNVGQYHFLVARRPNTSGTHFTACAFLRQKLETDGDKLNGNVASYLYLFGGQVLYPRSEIRKCDFVVTSSDLLHMAPVKEETFRKVCWTITQMTTEPHGSTSETSSAEVDYNLSETEGKLLHFIFIGILSFLFR